MPIESAVRAFWPNFGINIETGLQRFTSTASLAQRVLDYYSIPYKGTGGGPIKGVDIKHLDALQIIKMSFLEEDASGGDTLTELINDQEGNLRIKKIAESEWIPKDEYYEFETILDINKCEYVMITGHDPLPIRQELNWKDLLSEVYNEIYDVGIMHSTCANGVFNQFCTIIYNDPQLDTAYEDGIDNFYEISYLNPWDSVVGYAKFIYYDGCENDTSAKITLSDTAKIVINLLENRNISLGNLQKRPVTLSNIAVNPACLETSGEAVRYKDGIPIVIPEEFRYVSTRGVTEDKFNGVVGVYVVGTVIDSVYGVPKNDKDALIGGGKGSEHRKMVHVDRMYDEVIHLELGRHWLLGVDTQEGGSNYSIVFIDNSRIADPISFSGGSDTYELSVDCMAAQGKVGKTITGVILPTGPTSGVLVREIYVALELNTPSIDIYHPDGKNNKARFIAENIEYGIAPIVVTDEPPPIVINGITIRQEDSLRDHDPTTVESDSFNDTQLEKYYKLMDKVESVQITMSCLSEGQCKVLSRKLKEFLNMTNKQTNYICGPLEEPCLGDKAPDGGIVNSINYSYQDSNSYTISVNTGGLLTGNNMTQIQGGPHIKATESHTSKGTIIQDRGNGAYFKVRVDGFGDVFAVSMVPAILRVGDKVSVSIHNNPLEA